jgi:GNAT superfamily N-acetyltransferase
LGKNEAEMERQTVPDIVVRDFREEDRPAVLSFSQHTWSWGDYLPRVLDQWLESPDGRVRVAQTPEGRTIGIQHYERLSPDESWLSGLRVDPDFRLQGVATLFLEDGLEAAAQDGVHTLRYASEVSNDPVQRLSQTRGLRPRGTWISLEKVLDEKACRLGRVKPPLQASTFPVQPGDRHRVLSLLHASGHSLYVHGWAWTDLDAEAVDGLIEGRRAFVSRSGFGGWGVAAIGVETEGQLEVTLLGPDVSCALALIHVIERRACQKEPGVALLAHVPQQDAGAVLLSSLARRGDWRPTLEHAVRIWEYDLAHAG